MVAAKRRTAKSDDLRKKKYGKLRVLSLLRTESNVGRIWQCRCKCGKLTEASTGKLVCGHKTSCGCGRKARAAALVRKGTRHPKWKGYEGITGSLWHRIRASAAARGISFEITIEEAWELYQAQEGRCKLSGVPLYMVKNSFALANGANTASLDRIDNEKGYVVGNVQWVHTVINYMKGTLPQLEFLSWCRMVAERDLPQ